MIGKIYGSRCFRTPEINERSTQCEDCALVCTGWKRDCRKCISAKLGSTINCISAAWEPTEGGINYYSYFSYNTII